jgi:MYXO-CTERM domain-containing protein
MMLGTDPNDDDTDDDGILDGNEDKNHDGVIQKTETSPLDPDSDNDKILDGSEIGLTKPQGTDTDTTVFVADKDPSTKTNPVDVDTDDGSVQDGAEDENRNGKIDPGETDPNNPLDDVPGKIDSDKDGLTDDIEDKGGTNPLDPDSDDDRLLDGEEDANKDGMRGDNETDPLDADTDDGGVNDGDEVLDDKTDPLEPKDDRLNAFAGGGIGGCAAPGAPFGNLGTALSVLFAAFALRRRKQ